MKEIYGGFPQSVQVNTRTVPSNNHDFFPVLSSSPGMIILSLQFIQQHTVFTDTQNYCVIN
jgi:hypothetical protein